MFPANESVIRKYLRTDIPKIIIKDSLGSTNTYLKELSKNEDLLKTVVIADTQTKGRGRTGNSFFSPEGGLYMSILLPFETRFQKTPGLLTAFSAVSVCRAVEKITGKSPLIKWVNDVYLENKKICGILTEGTSDNLILGIGINIIPPENGFPDDIKNKAGSIFSKLDVPNDIKSILAAEIINNVINTISDTDYSSYTEEYKDRSMLNGKKISYLKNGSENRGIVLGIDNNLQLIIDNNGIKETLSSGEIRLTEWE